MKTLRETFKAAEYHAQYVATFGGEEPGFQFWLAVQFPEWLDSQYPILQSQPPVLTVIEAVDLIDQYRELWTGTFTVEEQARLAVSTLAHGDRAGAWLVPVEHGILTSEWWLAEWACAHVRAA